MKAIQISCGSRHTGLIGIKGRNKVVYTWGGGETGQLGSGKRDNELIPVEIDVGHDCIMIACGVFHTCVITKNKEVLSMGGNNFGQLGTGNRKSSNEPILIKGLANIKKIACGQHSAAVNEDGDLYI